MRDASPALPPDGPTLTGPLQWAADRPIPTQYPTHAAAAAHVAAARPTRGGEAALAAAWARWMADGDAALLTAAVTVEDATTGLLRRASHAPWPTLRADLMRRALTTLQDAPWTPLLDALETTGVWSVWLEETAFTVQDTVCPDGASMGDVARTHLAPWLAAQTTSEAAEALLAFAARAVHVQVARAAPVLSPAAVARLARDHRLASQVAQNPALAPVHGPALLADTQAALAKALGCTWRTLERRHEDSPYMDAAQTWLALASVGEGFPPDARAWLTAALEAIPVVERDGNAVLEALLAEDRGASRAMLAALAPLASGGTAVAIATHAAADAAIHAALLDAPDGATTAFALAMDPRTPTPLLAQIADRFAGRPGAGHGADDEVCDALIRNRRSSAAVLHRIAAGAFAPRLRRAFARRVAELGEPALRAHVQPFAAEDPLIARALLRGASPTEAVTLLSALAAQKPRAATEAIAEGEVPPTVIIPRAVQEAIFAGGGAAAQTLLLLMGQTPDRFEGLAADPAADPAVAPAVACAVPPTAADTPRAAPAPRPRHA